MTGKSPTKDGGCTNVQTDYRSKKIVVVYAVVQFNKLVPSLVDGWEAFVRYETGNLTVLLRASNHGENYRWMRGFVVIDHDTGLEVSPFFLRSRMISSIFNSVGMNIVPSE